MVNGCWSGEPRVQLVNACIPQDDHRLIRVGVLARKYAQRRGVEQKALSVADRQTDPAGGEGTEEVTVREHGHVTARRAEPRQNPVDTRGDLGRRLAAGTAVLEQIPVRVAQADVRRGNAFVFAVVPLGERRFNPGHVGQARQLARSSRTLQRTAPDLRKPHLAQQCAEPTCLLFPALGQRDVRHTRVLARERPRGFAVSNEVESRDHVVPMILAWAARNRERG